MEDLGNERRAVADRLRALNIEPVNAEELAPDGSSSWELLEEEIRSCQIFILISGRCYGWVPTTGPGSKEKHSVTEMEAEFAQKSGLVILPFFLNLKPGEKETDDTKARDAFRKRIQDWTNGRFRQMFNWADELADRVGDSISAVLASAFRRQFEARTTLEPVLRPASDTLSFRRAGAEAPATDLHSVIAKASWVAKRAVLFAGAGMSIAAGYPTSAVLKQLFLDDLKADAAEVDRLEFTAMAEVFQERFGRKALIDRTVGELQNSDAFGPTRAHIAAVRVFDTILTTNFDLLFESACHAVRRPYTVVSPSSMPVSKLPSE